MRELLDPSWCAIFVLENVEDRNGRGGALITSQIPVYRWHDFFGEPTLAVAILERIVDNAHRLQLRVDSLRKRRAAGALPLNLTTK